MTSNRAAVTSLPVKHDPKMVFISSIFITVLVAVASLAGVLNSESVYPSDELRQSFLPNDVVNLCVGLPFLIVSMWLVQRGRLIGLLFWPGALLFVVYTYLAYIIVMPLGLPYLLHLTLAAVSVYTMTALIASINADDVKRQLVGVVRERLAGGVLIAMGALFLLRVIALIVGSLNSGVPIGEIDMAVNTADFFLSPALIIGGVSLWQRRSFGYVVGLGLLFNASMLFIGLVIFLLIQPAITNAPFELVDVVVILVMGSICFVPTFLYVRGVVRDRTASNS
jgi:hypothetical protein